MGDRPDGGVPVDRQVGPVLPRLVLGMRLRRLREGQGISREEAGAAIHASGAKISRMELGRTACKPPDVADLCELYGVIDHAERTTLLELARQAMLPAWWQPYGGLVPGWFETYLGLEQAAEIIRSYEVQFIPGLLQTPEYAREVIMLGHGNAPDTEIERRVELRMRRQLILRRPKPTRLWMVIDEAALRRPIGGAAAMTHQLKHLMDVCELPHVQVQVIPFSVGGHAGAGGPVTLLRLPESRLPDFVYLEQLASAVYPGSVDHVDFYRHVLDQLVIQAEPTDATPAILRRILNDL